MSKQRGRKDNLWWYKGLQIGEEDVRKAMANTTSNMKAAQYLEISLPTYKKYASMYRDGETGKTLYEIHQNQSMKNVVGRTWISGKKRINWDNILREGQKCTPERLQKLSAALLSNNKLEHKCYRCNFEEKRLEDSKIPILMNFKNGNKSDWRIQNIEMVCYNCSFLYCLDFYDNSVIYKVQNIPLNADQGKKEKKDFYKLDDFYLNHVTKMGLKIEDGFIEKIQNTEVGNNVGNEFLDFV
jgi:hypothetical protein